ncbi:MAG TPA: hypothetical protein VN033_06375 [Vulgatibacter sp.]|nr:hypothetical protein [Vulgatibacter sp.]
MAESGRRRLAIGALFGIAALGIAGAVVMSQRLPDGAQEPVWDREPCAHCLMHVGDPSFAAQMQLRDGRILHFDDPGCLLEQLPATHREDVHAVWFHHVREDRWIRGDEVAFLRTEPTPMGYGLGAVDRGSPGSISLDEAIATLSNEGRSEDGHGRAP